MYPFALKSEVFPRYSQDGELLEMEPFTYLESEVNRISPKFIRWVQESLNKILGLKLKTDGIMGPQTRSAIRSFQQKQQLLVDGVAGPATIRALIGAGALKPPQDIIATDVIVPADARLDRFDFDKSDLKPLHIKVIDKLATKIADSWRSGRPIMTVRVIGHTDSEGRPDYNLRLGGRRALAVRKALMNALESKKRNLSFKVLILADSKGEYELIDITKTPEGQARNRRVEVFLSTKALLPLPKPPAPTAAKGTLLVRVVYADGRPAKGAEVYLYSDPPYTVNNDYRKTSDGGVANFGARRPGTYKVSATYPRYHLDTQFAKVVGGKETSLTLTLRLAREAPRCPWAEEVDWNEKFQRHFDSACQLQQAIRTFCNIGSGVVSPPQSILMAIAQLFGTGYALPDICRMSTATLESKIDDYVRSGVYAEVVAETGIFGGIGDCIPTEVIRQRYAQWKQGRKCFR